MSAQVTSGFRPAAAGGRGGSASYNDPLNKTDPLGLRPKDGDLASPIDSYYEDSCFSDIPSGRPVFTGQAPPAEPQPIEPTFCGVDPTENKPPEVLSAEERLDQAAAQVPFNWQPFVSDIRVGCLTEYDGICHEGSYGPAPSTVIYVRKSVVDDPTPGKLYQVVAHEIGHAVVAPQFAPGGSVITSVPDAWQAALGTSDVYDAWEYVADCLALHWGASLSFVHYKKGGCSASETDFVVGLLPP